MNHQVDHSNDDHGFTAMRQCFVVFRQAAVLTKPGEGSLDNPTLWQNLKTLGLVRPLNDLHLKFWQDFCYGLLKLRPLIPAIGKQFFEEGKRPEQRG